MKEHAKKKGLTGIPWKNPTKSGIKFVEQVVNHRDENDGVEFELIWDNGYRWWALGKDATTDAPDLVKAYKKKAKLK